jgi:hypothetical protein
VSTIGLLRANPGAKDLRLAQVAPRAWTAYGTLTSVAVRKKPVHLFANQILIADRWTQRDKPAEYYAVEGDLYDVASYVEILEQDGSDGFNVQLVVRPRATGSRRVGHHV